MEPCYEDLNNKIDNTQKIILKEFISILKDKDWHNLFEFHEKHRISPLAFVESIKFLKEHQLIEMKEKSIRLSLCIDNKGVLLLNRLMKTEAPHLLSLHNL